MDCLPKPPLSAVFFGSQSLLVQCLDRFTAAGHEVRAVVSADPTARHWAEERQIPIFDPGPAAVGHLAGVAFDYLFSVVHLSLVPAEILALPFKGAVNFHDGPLPRYAGLNVTSWALLNREREHGVSWHVMEPKVDTGDVLEEATFQVSDDDTALTVNAKCYEAGLQSFDRLVEQLERGTVTRRSQDLHSRGYYGRYRRPPHGSIIDWAQSAEHISALVRALDFGPYANPLAAAKLWVNGIPLIVRQAKVLPVESSRLPGTIDSIANDSLTVATSDRDVRLGGFHSLTGRPVDIQQVLRASGVGARDRLEPIGPGSAAVIERMEAQTCRHEQFWVERLREVEPLEIPYARRRVQGSSPMYRSLTLSPPPGLCHGEASEDTFLAATLLYLGRIGRKRRFDVLYRDVEPASAEVGADRLFREWVPLRISIEDQQTFADFRAATAGERRTLREHGCYPLDLVARHPEVTAVAGRWHDEPAPVAVQLLPAAEKSSRPADVDLFIDIAMNGRMSHWHYRVDAFDESTIARMQRQLLAVLRDAADERKSVSSLSILSDEEAAELLESRNTSARAYPRESRIHELFEAQAQRSPHSKAVTCRDTTTSYAELDARANRIAHHLLVGCDVRPGSVVGILMDRSDAMVAAMMGVLKAGSAYVPLDPIYPPDRLAYMVADAGLTAILTESRHTNRIPGATAQLVPLDNLAERLETYPATNVSVPGRPSDLAYVIYTSGTTGAPKGVMVEHRNVVNFFAGMDDRVGGDPPGTWLAVTSISFDISVLELFWTLARGFEVVIWAGNDRAPNVMEADAPPEGTRHQTASRARPIDFSLFYFASDASDRGRDKYGLLLEGAKYADANGFAAVWTPERHFHAFGGLYPNPAVTGAAVAAITHKVQIRAGSCVLPLHNPIRVAEEWALVDNLSNGRVGISFASGWQPDDFVIEPKSFADRHRIFSERMATVRALWRGETLTCEGPRGPVEIQTLPRPVQPELPCWVTAAGNPETFRLAGELGANILTHLLGQSIDELRDKLVEYRAAWRRAGHQGTGCATVMLHTFVTDDEAHTRRLVERPLKEYLRTATELVKKYASTFPAFRGATHTRDLDESFRALSPDDMEALLTHAFHRYYETSGLFGTPRGCLAMVDRLKDIGVDEIACLIDFGCPPDAVLANLRHLNELRKLAMPAAATSARGDQSIAALMKRHHVTHLQCTPSMATMLAKDTSAREGLQQLQVMMVGGEAFPPDLARDLVPLVRGRVINMYGPTETTIWSSTHELTTHVDDHVPLGAPIANTQIYILDEQLQPLPAGVPGELVIAGDGVARGYVKRESLTAERFVDDPFDGSDARRMYRTGDLARRSTDGSLEFLGRMDTQVKVRGYRIELGEIESALNQHPAVQQSVVMARDDGAGTTRLVGYVVAERAARVASDDLREFLRSRLPDFMVPSSFVTLDEFPLTPNRKVNRRALPAPEPSRPDLTEAFVAPRTPDERRVAAIWSDVLGMERLGVNDRFSDVGGDSLTAVQIAARIGEEFDVNLPLHAFFQAPTVASLAGEIQRLVAERVTSSRSMAV
jgi:natural product biosynthesis luciferase-like monooxygenase protein